MRRIGIFLSLFTSVTVLVVAAASIDVAAEKSKRGSREVILWDDCDPTDPAWLPTGGCTLREGSVTEADFRAYLFSPLHPSQIGHPAWWFEPGFLTIAAGKSIKVSNDGGRTHTFTEVANYGGGRVPPLNQSRPGSGAPPLTPAPECVSPGVIDIPGGGKSVVEGLAPGDHRFQCCIHPWMRTLVRVSEKEK
jgi:plastocyanin